MSARVILLDASPTDPQSGADVRVRLAGGGGAVPYYYGGEHWQAGIAALPVIITSSDFDGTDLGTGSVPQAMELRWSPARATQIADMAQLYWAGAPASVRIGPEGAFPPEELVGSILDVSAEADALKIALTDPAVDLKRPVLVDRYLGTGGIEGPIEWEGVIKPRAWGRVFNVKGDPIDAANNIYCFGDPTRPWGAFDAVRDKGAAAAPTDLETLAWQGSAEATFAALQAAEAPAGGGVLCASIACIKWWTKPAGDLRVDARGETEGGYVETAPEIAQRLVAARSELAFAAGEIAAFAALRPGIAGWLADDESTTVAATLDQILGDVSLLWALDATGTITLREWAWGMPVTEARSQDVVRRTVYKPVTSRSLGYRANQHPMSRGDIAAIVFATDVTFADGSSAEDLKPAEGGATRGAPSGTPVAGLPAEEVAGAAEVVNDPVTGFVAQVERIDEILVMYGDIASAADSATAALNAKAAAEAAKLAAENAETAASGSASAAAGSANTATAAASEAGDYASGANASMINAQAASDTAATQAGIATTQAATATGAASTAVSQSSLAAAHRTQAVSENQLNKNFALYRTGWQSRSDYHDQAIWDSRGADIGPDWGEGIWFKSGQVADVYSAARYPVFSDRKYRFTVRLGTSYAGTVSRFYVGFICYDSAGTPLGGMNKYVLAADLAVPAGQRVTRSVVVTGASPAPDFSPTFFPGTTHIQLIGVIAYTGTSPGSTSYLTDFGFEDITESDIAATQAGIATSSAAMATAQSAIAQTSATLAASVSTGALNPNAQFHDWPGVETLNNWAVWVLGGTYSKTVGQYPNSNALRLTNTAGNDHGLLIEGVGTGEANIGMKRPAPGWYVVTAKVKLVSGSLRSAGVLLYTVNDGAGYIAEPGNMRFETHPDTNGEAVGLGVAGRVYTFTKLLYCSPDAVNNGNFRLYAMNSWSNFHTENTAKTLDWYECSIRPATETEVRFKAVVEPLEATVKEAAGVAASAAGKTSAYWQTELNAGGAGSFISARAETQDVGSYPITLVPYLNTKAVGRKIVPTLTTPMAWGDSMGYTTEFYTNGAYIQASVGPVGSNFFGLSEAPLASTSFGGLDYSWHYSTGGSMNAYELGVHVGSFPWAYNPNDIFSIEYRNGTVTYRHNGRIVWRRTTSTGRTFYGQFVFAHKDTYIDNVVFGPSDSISSSAVSIGADEIHFYNRVDGGYIKGASVVGGNVITSGGLHAGAFIRLGSGAGWSVALASRTYPCLDGTAVSFETTLPNVPDVDFTTVGLDPLGTGETYQLYAEGLSTTGFTARLKIITPGTVTPQTQNGATTPGTGPTMQMVKTNATISTFGQYTFTFGVQIPNVQPYNSEPWPGGGAQCDYGGTVTVGLYVKRSGVWTRVGGQSVSIQTSAFRSGPPYSITLSKSVAATINLGTAAIEAFGVAYESASVQLGSGNSSATGSVYVFPKVDWSVSSSSTSRSATSSGTPVPITVRPK